MLGFVQSWDQGLEQWFPPCFGGSIIRSKLGAGTIVCVTLGTGVGGGIILDEKLWRGVDGAAAEIGHMCVDPFGGVACGDDGGTTSGKSVDEVRAAINEELAAEKSGNAENYLKHVTDRWLKTVSGKTREEVKSDPSSIQSEDLPNIDKITVSGSKAVLLISFPDQGGSFDYRNSVDMVKEGGVWKLDVLHVLSAAKTPSGSK